MGEIHHKPAEQEPRQNCCLGSQGDGIVNVRPTTHYLANLSTGLISFRLGAPATPNPNQQFGDGHTPETRVHTVHAILRARLAHTYQQRESHENDNKADPNQEGRSCHGQSDRGLFRDRRVSGVEDGAVAH